MNAALRFRLRRALSIVNCGYLELGLGEFLSLVSMSALPPKADIRIGPRSAQRKSSGSLGRISPLCYNEGWLFTRSHYVRGALTFVRCGRY